MNLLINGAESGIKHSVKTRKFKLPTMTQPKVVFSDHVFTDTGSISKFTHGHGMVKFHKRLAKFHKRLIIFLTAEKLIF